MGERQDATLAQFGATIDPPRVRKRTAVTLGERTVGYICHDLTRDCACYVSERDPDDHRYRGEDPHYDFPFDGEGYGLSTELYGRLVAADASRVYIAEPETGAVYHFGFQQFVDGTPINMHPEASGRGYEKDPQKVVPVAQALYKWEWAYPDLYAKQHQFE